jgi:hypothetical protein
MDLSEPLPSADWVDGLVRAFASNDRRYETHRLMAGIYEVSRSDGLKWHDMHTKFHGDWFRGGDTQTE